VHVWMHSDASLSPVLYKKEKKISAKIISRLIWSVYQYGRTWNWHYMIRFVVLSGNGLFSGLFVLKLCM